MSTDPIPAEKTTSELPDPSFREVLQNQDFVKILIAQVGSNFGDAVLRVALLLYVYAITGSLTITTIVLAAQIAPWIIFGPIAGVFADRISRKAIMIVADLIRGLSVILFTLTTNVTHLLVITFVIGIASASFTAPRAAAIPEITGMRLYVKAISLSQMIFQTISIIGPLVSAIIYAYRGSQAFFMASFFYFFSALFILLTHVPSAQRSKEEITIKLVVNDLREGFSYLLTEKLIRKIIILFTILIFGGVFAGTLLYPYIYDIIYEGVKIDEPQAQREFGFLGAIIAIGSIIGFLIFGKFEKQIGRQRGIFFGSIGFGIFYFIFIFHPTIIILYLIGIAFGFFNGMTSLTVNAIFAETVPNEIRGRAYSATNAYIQVFSVMSISLSGITADTFGIINTIVGAGLFLIICVGLFAWKTNFFEFVISPNSTTTSGI